MSVVLLHTISCCNYNCKYQFNNCFNIYYYYRCYALLMQIVKEEMESEKKNADAMYITDESK